MSPTQTDPFSPDEQRSTGDVRDPVCGMQVRKAVAQTLNVGATTYYFCSADCRDKFADGPDMYVDTLDEADAFEFDDADTDPRGGEG